MLAKRTNTIEDKIALRYEKSGDKIELLSFLNNSAVSLNLQTLRKSAKKNRQQHYGYEVFVLRQSITKGKYSFVHFCLVGICLNSVPSFSFRHSRRKLRYNSVHE